MSKHHLCGPKLSLCCSLISVWAIVHMLITGALFYCNAVNMSHDLGLVHDDDPMFTDETPTLDEAGKERYLRDFYAKVDSKYEKLAFASWKVAGIYVLIGVISIVEFSRHNKLAK